MKINKRFDNKSTRVFFSSFFFNHFERFFLFNSVFYSKKIHLLQCETHIEYIRSITKECITVGFYYKRFWYTVNELWNEVLTINYRSNRICTLYVCCVQFFFRLCHYYVVRRSNETGLRKKETFNYTNCVCSSLFDEISHRPCKKYWIWNALMRDRI